jgi:hypothetical protein
LEGDPGDDTLVGGPGNDLLNGETGDDSYIWDAGDGNDTIHDYYGTNTLIIGDGIEPSDVKFTRAGTSYRDAVFIMPSGERITVEMWYSGSAYQMDEIHFADGTVWTRATVNSFNPLFEGTSGPDTIQGSPGDDILAGFEQDDRLEGSSGSDTYIWNVGDGSDAIYDSSGTNTLIVGEGVNPADLSLSRSGNDLVIEFNDLSSGSVTVERWYSGSSYRLYEIHFSDGTVWSRSDISAIAAGTVSPFARTSASGSGRSSRVFNINDPTWIDIEDLERTRYGKDSGSAGSSGGCGAGPSWLAVGIALLVKAASFRKGRTQ